MPSAVLRISPRSFVVVASAAAIAGCGGSSTSSSRTLPSEAAPTHAQTTPTTTGTGGAPQATPSAEASVTVSPLTVSPGRTLTVILHAPAGTREASAALSGAGGSVMAPATPGPRGFVATLVVPRGLKGGFWPVVVRYGAASLSASVSTEVKVFTP
jgi:hypothetical protein